MSTEGPATKRSRSFGVMWRVAVERRRATALKISYRCGDKLSVKPQDEGPQICAFSLRMLGFDLFVLFDTFIGVN
jgi:hypothetical protein